MYRFVSLLPFQRRPSVGDQRVQAWNSPHAFLATGRGDGSDHALLLCSLLLGFGLDAFVCVGRVHNSGSEETAVGGNGAASGFGGEEDGRSHRGRGEETGHMVRRTRLKEAVKGGVAGGEAGGKLART